jgi:hypothetical protein
VSDDAQKVSSESVPVSEVVLFSSGVGYFARSGQVSGNAQLEIQFSSEEINDLLKSLVVLDQDGGRVSVVTYASQDPTGKALRAFGLDLTGSPSLGQLFGQMRGVRVAVTAADGDVEGEVVGVESRTRKTEGGDVISSQVLNLLTAEGLRSFPVEDLRRTRVLDEGLDADLRKALAVLARSRDTQKRSVSVEFVGEGQRRVRLAYILAAPVWKTSYRLIIDEEPLLQGWSIVENTTDTDWKDVRLSLVSGRPISFIQDLYTPLYLPRPTVQPQLHAGLRPVVPGEAMSEVGSFEDEEMEMPPPAPAMKAARSMASPAVYGGGVRDDVLGEDMDLAASSMAAAAEGGEAGELFRYTISTPVTIARQSSAMLPIVASKVEGRKLSLYNGNNHPTHPYNCYEMANSSGLSLLAGPVTVFDEGVYAGDAQLPNLQPDEKRLVSYGLDLACTVEVSSPGHAQEMTTVKISKGVARISFRQREEADYLVKNKKEAPRTVVVEHPYAGDRKLVSPEKCEERTDEYYRFPVEVEAKATKRLKVITEYTYSSGYSLASMDVSQIAYYADGPASGAVKKALAEVTAMRGELADEERRRGELEGRKARITEDQKRIRADLKSATSSSKLHDRYLRKLEAQEDEIDRIEGQLDKVTASEEKLRAKLEKFLAELTVE